MLLLILFMLLFQRLPSIYPMESLQGLVPTLIKPEQIEWFREEALDFAHVSHYYFLEYLSQVY